MKLQVRLCVFAVVMSWSALAVAQEDPPIPEDPSTTEPETEAERDPEPAIPSAPDDTPVGTPTVVEETRRPAAEVVPEKEETTVTEETELLEVVEDAEDPLRTAFLIRSEGTSSNNLDMRPLNNETFIDIYDSDDRQTLLFTLLGADVEYDVLNDTTVAIGASHSGAWGGDSLGAANAFGGIFFVDRLNVDWRPLEGDGLTFATRIGRQRFSIGGMRTDFLLDDIIDGVVVEAGFGKAGKLRLVPLDVYAVQRPDDINFGAALGFGGPDVRSPSVGFDGDTNTFRFGGVYENTELVDGLGLRVFGFYADIGAGSPPHTGADRVFYGSHGNFSDNDYNWMGGTRIGYTLKADVFELGVVGEYARSGGLDRKPVQLGVRDVTAEGNAFGGAVEPRLDLGDVGLRAIGQFFMADGGSYTGDEGLLFNYGFVGMKGAQIGGLNMSRYAGWHPSAYVGTRGVHYSPQDVSRKAGTMVIRGGAGLSVIEKLHLDLDAWLFRDTGNTGIADFDDVGVLADELPFGYTEADLIPQERLGKSLGVELNARLRYDPSNPLSFYAMGGVFLPGEFYEIEIPRTGGTALGAEDPATFWALLGGAAVTF